MSTHVSAKENEIYKLIGKRIKEIRQEKGLTQEAIASKTGLAAKYVGFIEQGRKRPRIHILVNVASALGCNIKDFFVD